jgi:glutamate/tyrosine decarboxylase-like PLP-dependent enzyme
MGIKEQGIDKFRRLIEQNIGQARYLAGLVSRSTDLELLAPVPLNIVCFRYRGERSDDPELDELNEQLLCELQERGIAVPSHNRLDGRFCLRVAITNHRSRREDFDALVETVVVLGRRLEAAGGPGP